MSWKEEAREIEERRRLALAQGGPEAVARQHEQGRLSVRERIDALIDPGSFREQGRLVGHSESDEAGRLKTFTPANYVLGMAQIDARPCVVGGEDFTLRGGSPSPAGLRKSVYAESLALTYRLPLVRLLEGGGGSVAGSAGKDAPRTLPDAVFAPPRFRSIMQVMGTVPVASAALGPVAGFPAARLAASHFSVMARHSAQVMIGGPQLVRRATGEELDKEALGGAQVHGKSGVVDNIAKDEADAFAQLCRFLSYLPTNVWSLPPVQACDDPVQRRDEALVEIIPRDRRKIYDARELVAHVLDLGSLFEIGTGYGRSQITMLARLGGRPVGVWANDPRFYAGAMGAEAAQKVRRFIDMCDTFHLPLICFVDEPGFMIGAEAERSGTIRYGAAAIFAMQQAQTPVASVIVRKAYGVAAAAHFGPGGFVLAWPSAESGALPLEGGVAVAFRREIEAAEDPDRLREELEDRMAQRRNPYARAETFSVHDLVDPRETRPALAEWLELSWPLLEQQLGPRAYTMRP